MGQCSHRQKKRPRRCWRTPRGPDHGGERSMTIREFSGPSREQLEGIREHLDANPIKVPVRSEDGEGWVFWEPSAQAVDDEARRAVLREAEARYRHEIMD